MNGDSWNLRLECSGLFPSKFLLSFLLFVFLMFQLIEVQRSQFQSQEDLRQQIKMASFIAGLQAKQVVLFVPEGVNDQSMQDICSLMGEGKS